MSLSYSHHNSIFDEHHWIIHIRRLLDDEDLHQESEIHVSIFNVPKSLVLSSPESYVPQVVALGPNHHSRPELHDMENCKLFAAKRLQKHFQGPKFHNLVDQLNQFEPRFRACYQKYLNFNGETLIWMLAVDSCFLIEFLRGFKGDGGLNRADRKSGRRDAVIRDILMLENQVPLFLLRKTLELLSGSLDHELNGLIHDATIAFFEEVSPFKTIQQLQDVNQITESAHLLEFLYRSTVQGVRFSDEGDEGNEGESLVSRIKAGLYSSMKRLVISKPVKFILTFPWKIISSLPGVILIKQVEYLCFSGEKKEENETSEINKHPLMEEIAIPSVTELSNAGVKFSVTKSGISSINFDSKNVVLYLPPVVLDLNTEVIMRNLVAYEACSESGPLIFTRYTELMNGIIDSEEDAKILREKKIVLNHLKSDQDVADLWNGMSKSIRLTKVPLLDKVIEDVNSYYSGTWRVRIGMFLKKHVFGSWQSITFFVAILLLFSMSFQTFCSLFGCVNKRR